MKNLLAAALLPAVALMWYIRKKDRIEQEPMPLVLSLLGLGAATVISALILETVGGWITSALPVPNTVYLILEYFIVVAGSEELGKFVVMKLRTWKSPEFNYTYDAIVYAVAASLGFAALENIMYVFTNGGFSTAILRALTAVPGHAVFGVFMGVHYGLAKRANARGDKGTETRELFLAYLIPVLIHGFYDFCLSAEGWFWIVIFFIFYITMIIVAFIKVKHLSDTDAPVDQDVYPRF